MWLILYSLCDHKMCCYLFYTFCVVIQYVIYLFYLTHIVVCLSGSSEATFSLAWTSSNTIITGMNKYLRVVDMRG